MRLLAGGVILIGLLAGCGKDGATKFDGVSPDAVEVFGFCAFCHTDKAVSMLPAGGDPKCEVCHEDRAPGNTGPGHRSIPGPERVPSFVGPSHRLGDEARFGSCAFCHNNVASTIAVHLHGRLKSQCEVCHEDERPGEVGLGHRRIPACAQCHLDAQRTHMDPAAGTRAECVQCHTPHGSPNLSLIRERIVTASGIEAEVLFDNRSGRADGSFASASQPGTGVCEVCHRATRHYRGDGSGEPHFTLTCTTCHAHGAGFAPP